MISTYRAELKALISAGLLKPSPEEKARLGHASREARRAIAEFRQQWKALPSRR